MQRLCHKSPHQSGDVINRFVHGKVAGFEDMNLGTGNVALVRVNLRQSESRVIFAPNYEHGRLVRAQVVLPGRIRNEIALVVIKQRNLDLGYSRLAQVRKFVVPEVGIVPLRTR